MRQLCMLLIGFFVMVAFVSAAGGNKPIPPQTEIWTVNLSGFNIVGSNLFNPADTPGVETKAVYTPPSRSCSDYCVGSGFEVKLTASVPNINYTGFEMEEASQSDQVRCNFAAPISAPSPNCLAEFLNSSPYPSTDYQYSDLKVSLYGINFKEMEIGGALVYDPSQPAGAINRARVYLNVGSKITDCSFPYSSVASSATTSVVDGTVTITRTSEKIWRISVEGVSLNLGEYGYENVSTRKGVKCSYYYDSDYDNGIWTWPISFEMTFTLQQ